MHPDEFFQIRDFSPNFGYKILDSSHVMLARDVILGGVVRFTMLVLFNKKFLIFGVITKSPRSCYVWAILYGPRTGTKNKDHQGHTLIS